MTHFNDSFARSRITYFFACDVAISIISRNRIAGDRIAARDCDNKIPAKCIGLSCNLAKFKCITNCVHDLTPRSNTPSKNIPLKFYDQPDAILRYRSPSSRGRRILSSIVYDGCLIKATILPPPFLSLSPLPIRRRPCRLPRKMAAQFLEAVRNRRVNIGRSISVFGRGGKRRWHAASNTGVMQRHTQPQKSRATHPRALRPLRRGPFSSSFLSVHRQP